MQSIARLLLCMLIASLSIGWAPSVQAQESLKFENIRAFATSPKQRNGAVFMDVINTTNDIIKITGAQSQIADRVELHTHTMEGGVMMMRQLPYYEVPAQERMALDPMGHHIMLIGLKEQLNIGNTFNLTLNLDGEKPLVIDVEIVAPGAKSTPSNHGRHHDHSHP